MSHAAKHKGILKKPETPLVDEKLAETDKALDQPLETVVKQVVDDSHHGNELIQDIIPYMPDIDPASAWIHVIGSAVVIRTAFSLYNRITLNKHLATALPHSQWYRQQRDEYFKWRSQRDLVKMDEVSRNINQFAAERNLKGSASWARRQFVKRSVLMFGFNVAMLNFLSLVYETQLASAPFLWIPSLLDHDQSYVLPAVNLMFCAGLYAISRGNMVFSDKVNSSGKLPGASKSIRKFATYAGLLWGCSLLLPYLSINVPTIYILFWTASNFAGLIIAALIAESDTVRGVSGLMAKEQYSSLLKSESALIAAGYSKFEQEIKTRA